MIEIDIWSKETIEIVISFEVKNPPILGKKMFHAFIKDSAKLIGPVGILGAILNANSSKRINSDGDTTGSHKLKAPAGLQKHEAFAALYNSARPFGFGALDPNVNDPLESPLHAKQVYAVHCPNDHCDYVRGRLIKTSFQEYPLLNNWGYDRDYGIGKMQKVLTDPNTLNKNLYSLSNQPTETLVDPELAINKGSSCEYFTYAYKAHTRRGQQDLERKFAVCSRPEKVFHTSSLNP